MVTRENAYLMPLILDDGAHEMLSSSGVGSNDTLHNSEGSLLPYSRTLGLIQDTLSEMSK